MTRWIIPTGALAAILFVAGLAAAPVAGAQDAQEQQRASGEEVRKEVSEAMEAIRGYTADRRDEAAAEIDEALTKLDAAIDRQETRLRENWDEMSEAARREAAEAAAELRRQRNRLAEWDGALKHGAQSAWDELKTGFSNAYDELRSAWEDADRKSEATDGEGPS